MGDQRYHEEMGKQNYELVKVTFTAIVLLALAIGVIYAVVSFYGNLKDQQILKMCLEQPIAFKEACSEFIRKGVTF